MKGRLVAFSRIAPRSPIPRNPPKNERKKKEIKKTAFVKKIRNVLVLTRLDRKNRIIVVATHDHLEKLRGWRLRHSEIPSLPSSLVR